MAWQQRTIRNINGTAAVGIPKTILQLARMKRGYEVIVEDAGPGRIVITDKRVWEKQNGPAKDKI